MQAKLDTKSEVNFREPSGPRESGEVPPEASVKGSTALQRCPPAALNCWGAGLGSQADTQ